MYSYNDLIKANSSINFDRIKSKRGNQRDYAKADERIKALKMVMPNAGINTKILSIADGVCIAHAEITDEVGRVIGAGTASKKQTEDNSDSFIEACETAAVARALRFCGIGLENIAQSQPVYDQTAQVIELAELRQKIMNYVIKHNFDEQDIRAICKRYEVSDIMDLNSDCCRHYINYIKKNGGDI